MVKAHAEQARAAFEKLPIAFVENRGQEDPRVRYAARGGGFAFYLTPKDVVMSLHKETPDAPGTALALRFLGQNPRTRLEATERVSGELNVLRGNDPAGFHTHIARYGAIVYRDLWPRIDLVVRGADGKLKYEFRVRRGGRPGDIRLGYDGAMGVALADDGSLAIHTPVGMLVDDAPIAWQDIDGVRVPVDSHYAVTARGTAHGRGKAQDARRPHDAEASSPEIRFTLGSYRADHDLVIDPSLLYATFLGGSSDDVANDMAVDAAGNVYLIGTTLSSDFPTTTGAFDRTFSPIKDVLVTKLNPTGSALVYSTLLGGNATPVPAGGTDEFEAGRGIAVDAAGNAYITGQTTSSNFPTTAGAFDRTLNVATFDATDAWVAKLNPTGSALVYSSFLGGFSLDDALAIAVDASGNAYVAGETTSSDFPTTAGAFDRTINGDSDTYIVKVNPAGSALVYSTYLGGEFVDLPGAIKVDGAGNATVVGSTRSTTYPTTAGAFDTTPNGMFDLYVTKLNAAGSALVFSTLIGGSDMEGPGDFAVDGAGNLYIAGSTASPTFPTTAGVVKTVRSGGADGFVLKLNATASALVFSTLLGGNDGDSTSGVALDAAGNLWVAGTTSSLDYPVTPDALSGVHSGGITDAVITQLNPTASAILYSTFYGGTQPDPAGAIALDGNGNVFVMGHTFSPDFPTTPGAFDRLFAGNPSIFWGDTFVLKLTTGVTPPSALSSLSISPTSVVGGNPSTGTARLSSAAPAGGAVVTLSNSHPAIASVPASVTIAAGAIQATFGITTTSVTSSTAVTIAGAFGGAMQAAALTVTPAATGSLPAPTLLSPAADARFAPGAAITFDVSDVTGAGSYQFQIDDAQTFTAPLVLDQVVSVSQLTTSSLPTQRMWWRARARDGAGNPGAWSASRRFEVKN
jgi:Beta-propeller repeat